MSEQMSKQEIAESSMEWNEPLEMDDWLSSKHAKDVLMDAFFDASADLEKELKELSVKEKLARQKFQSDAYNQIDCLVDDAYQEYKNMHPHTMGHMTETYSRIYPDGGK